MFTRRLSLLFTVLLWAIPLQASVNVSVGIEPIRYMVEQLGGEQVAVSTLLAGGDPHALDPTPTQLLSLRKADLYFAAGLPFERGLGDRLAVNDKLIWLDEERSEAHTERASAHDGHDDEGHDDGGHAEHHHDIDPHRWTSPAEMLRMGRIVSAELQRVDPAHAADYQARHAQFEQDVMSLKAKLAQILGQTPGAFVADHPAWGWFSDEFNLQQLAVEQGGKQPSIRQMSQLLKTISNSGARYVVSEHDSSQTRALAARLKLKLLVAKPLSYDWPGELLKLASGLATP